VVARRVAVTGAAGQLGRQLVTGFTAVGGEVLALMRPQFDITRASDLDGLVAWRPDVVVNSAAWTDVDGCARDPARAMQINAEAAGAVAAAASRAGAAIVQISTNEVFDGSLDRPYSEDDAPQPINPYGVSKLAGERLVAEANPRHVVVRTAWLFGPGGRNFVTKIMAAAKTAAERGEPLRVVSDEWGNPTDTPWLASAIVTLLALRPADVDGLTLHLAGEPPASRFTWAQAILGAGSVMTPVALSDFRRDTVVPPRAVLDTSRARGLGIPPGEWHEAARQVAASLN